MTIVVALVFFTVYGLVVTVVSWVLTAHLERKISLLKKYAAKADAVIDELREQLRRADENNADLSARLTQAMKNDTPRDPVTGQFIKVPR